MSITLDQKNSVTFSSVQSRLREPSQLERTAQTTNTTDKLASTIAIGGVSSATAIGLAPFMLGLASRAGGINYGPINRNEDMLFNGGLIIFYSILALTCVAGAVHDYARSIKSYIQNYKSRMGQINL